ncbi:MAG: prepilin-type N-terminal cleavage/methylation domain-containing protein [Candidatus Omnitrophota bacterium]
MIKYGNRRAVSLIELLMALALLGIVVVAGTVVTRTAFNAQKQAEDTAIFSFAEVAQGVEVVFQKVAVAQDFSLPSSSEVRFTSRGATGRIYQEASKLMYVGNISNPSSATVVLDNVKSTNFALDSLNRLVIEIEMNDTAKTKLRTAVRTRNPYEPQTTARRIMN